MPVRGPDGFEVRARWSWGRVSSRAASRRSSERGYSPKKCVEEVFSGIGLQHPT
jgi:hypothetical protein